MVEGRGGASTRSLSEVAAPLVSRRLTMSRRQAPQVACRSTYHSEERPPPAREVKAHREAAVEHLPHRAAQAGPVGAACCRRDSWQRARIAVPSVLAFTAPTLAVTLAHLSKSRLGAASVLTRLLTWGWLAIYVGVPPVLAFLWWRQARAVPSPAAGGSSPAAAGAGCRGRLCWQSAPRCSPRRSRRRGCGDGR